MPQTTVKNTPDIGMPGQIADLKTAAWGSIASKTSQEASAPIPFGVFVRKGTGDDGVKLLAATTNPLAGLVVFGQGYHRDLELTSAGLQPGATFDVAEKGNFFVRVEDAVTPASEVHVRVVTGGTNGYGVDGVGTTEFAGAVRGTADTTDCIEITAFARFVRSAAAGGIAELQFDMTMQAQQVADS